MRGLNIIETRELTELERSIGAAMAGFVDRTEVLKAFVVSTIVIPTASSDITDMADLQPLLFETPQGKMLAVFTHLDMIGEYAEKAKFALEVTGLTVLKSLAPDTGLVVNPNRPSGFDLTPEAIVDLKRSFDIPDPLPR